LLSPEEKQELMLFPATRLRAQGVKLLDFKPAFGVNSPFREVIASVRV